MTTSYFAWDLAYRADTPCVRDDTMSLDYATFAERVEAVAEQLAAHGISRGDVVATFLPNRAELLVTLMAAWRLGAIATPVNPAFTPAEAAYQLDDAHTRLVVGDPGCASPGRTVLTVETLAARPTPAWNPPAQPAMSDDALLIYTSGSTGRPKGVRLAHENPVSYTHLTLPTSDLV